MRSWWILLFALPMFTLNAQDLAEQQCIAIMNAAVASTVTECSSISGLGACLGSLPVSLDFSQEIAGATFENPGDRVGLALIDELQLGAFDDEAGEWGIVPMQVRLDLTDERVYLMAQGEVTIKNLGDVASNVPTAALTVVSSQGLNVRQRPEAEAALLDVVFTGNSIRATGHLNDNSWIRVQTAAGEHGWAIASAFDGTGFDVLLPVSADNLPDFGSMQAFELETGEFTESCQSVPPNGVIFTDAGLRIRRRG